jgi:hypothetical protein
MRLIYKNFYLNITDQLGFDLLTHSPDPEHFDALITHSPDTTLKAITDAITQQLILESI